MPDKSFIKFRPNWTYQQFLKLFFRHSESEYYFALDSDTIVIKDLPLFENEHPIWYYGWRQNHFPYFLFNKNFFNLNKSLSHTGIGDLGLFNKNIIQSFLNRTGLTTPEELLKIIGPKTNVVFHFSEYETYSNFANEFYKGLTNKFTDNDVINYVGKYGLSDFHDSGAFSSMEFIAEANALYEDGIINPITKHVHNELMKLIIKFRGLL